MERHKVQLPRGKLEQGNRISGLSRELPISFMSRCPPCFRLLMLTVIISLRLRGIYRRIQSFVCSLTDPVICQTRISTPFLVLLRPCGKSVIRMRDHVPVILLDLPTTIRGFVTLGSDFSPIIIINSRLSREQQRKTYQHEMNHIRRGDMYNEGYVEYGD